MKRNAVYASDENSMLDALVMFDLNDIGDSDIGSFDPDFDEGGLYDAFAREKYGMLTSSPPLRTGIPGP